MSQQPEETALPRVEGRCERTIAAFERACLVHLRDEQEKPNPDNALVALLCDGVRLAREFSASPPLIEMGRAQAPAVSPQPCQQCVALREALTRLTRYKCHVKRKNNNPLGEIQYVAMPPDTDGGFVRWADIQALAQSQPDIP